MKKVYYLSMMLLSVAVAMAACKPEDPAASLSVKPLSLEFAATGNQGQRVAVTATGTQWNHTVSSAAQEWLTAEVGEDGQSLLVTVTDNLFAEERIGTISVKAIDHIEIKSIGITVKQAAGEGADAITFTVSPDALTFEGTGAPAQEVTVTVSDETVTWTVAPDASLEGWCTVEAAGDKVKVSVLDNAETASRRGAFVVTPSRGDMKPKAVSVEQKGKEVLPSLSVTPTEIPVVSARGDMDVIVSVTAEGGIVWNVRAEYPEGTEGGWLNPVKMEINSAVAIEVYPNKSTEPRSGSIVIWAVGNEDIAPVVIPIEQEGGREFLSTLDGPVAIADMDPLGDLHYTVWPSQLWDTANPGTLWSFDMWSPGISQKQNMYGQVSYEGAGSMVCLSIISKNIPYNDDKEFTLPAGEYTVQPYPAIIYPEDMTPYTLVAGSETMNMNYPEGCWYMQLEDGKYVKSAPIVSGSMTVVVDGFDSYTFTFDLKDDAGNAITGTAKGDVTKANCMFFPQDPDETVDPNPEPEPDPGFGQ